MHLVLWERDQSAWPSDIEERMKLINMHMEMTRKDLEGDVKIWGVSPGGGKGFAITEGEGKEKIAGVIKYTPYYKFEIMPMLSIDEMTEVMKSMQK
jgi:hypothetical protein